MELKPAFYCITNPMGLNQPYSHPTPSSVLAEQAAAIENRYHRQADDSLTSETISLYVIPNNCMVVNKELLEMSKTVVDGALNVFEQNKLVTMGGPAVTNMCSVIQKYLMTGNVP